MKIPTENWPVCILRCHRPSGVSSLSLWRKAHAGPCLSCALEGSLLPCSQTVWAACDGTGCDLMKLKFEAPEAVLRGRRGKAPSVRAALGAARALALQSMKGTMLRGPCLSLCRICQNLTAPQQEAEARLWQERLLPQQAALSGQGLRRGPGLWGALRA
uniref:Uncharacterized protein n=1 Tax=Pipistrellus kuhlii TaxID=59472 RepID=A0A7J7R4N9_PIPKU|nr:hypothetical protein mPipKuh1_010843 [Pipistrellus kuhlii]